MKIAITKPLFAWDALEDSPSLQSLRALLESIPDHHLLESLRAARGKGRDDYPVEVLWGTLLLAIALRHISIDACLGELQRNPALAAAHRHRTARTMVPGPDNMSRFLATLGEEPHLEYLRRIFDTQVGWLGAVIGDLGTDTAGDSTGLAGRTAASEQIAPPTKSNKACRSPAADARSTRTTTATSPRSSSGSATNCICSSMSSTRSPWPITSPTPRPATTSGSPTWWTRRGPTCRRAHQDVGL